MTTRISFQPKRSLLFALAALLCGGASSQAAAPKTLMIMVDYFGQRSQTDTIIDLKVFQPTTEVKLVSGGVVPNPVLSNAYDTERFGWWYSLANFDPDDYVSGRVRFNTQYYCGWFQNDSTYRAKAGDTVFFPDTQTTFTYQNDVRVGIRTVQLGPSTPKFYVFDTASTYRGPKLYVASSSSFSPILNTRRLRAGVTLPGAIDSCMALYPSDTLWIRWKTPENPPSEYALAEDMKCFDHNPFGKTHGALAVFSPWSDAKAWAVVNGIAQPLRNGPIPGWYQGVAWTSPLDSTEALVKFQFARSNGEIKLADSSGAPFHLDSLAKPNFIVPTMGTLAGSNTATLPDSVVFAWVNPWKTQVAELQFGGDERIQGVWHPEGFYTAKIWGRPAEAALVSAQGDSSTPATAVPSKPSSPSTKPDTVWLSPKQAAPFKISLEGKAYDYRLGNTAVPKDADFGPKDTTAYFPFSQTANSHLLTGLVTPRLGHDGRPRWTGKSICGQSESYIKQYNKDSTSCTDSAYAVEKWFGPVLQGGKAMNATFPISITLSTIKNGALTYTDSLFFPLDTFSKLWGSDTFSNPFAIKSNPFKDTLLGSDLKKHNFGYCLELHGQAQVTPGAMLTVKADDDTWVFVDSQLVLDLGGQHSIDSQTVSLDRFSGSLSQVAAFDLFHCERHVNESGLFLSVNFPIYPVGTLAVPPRAGTKRPSTFTQKRLSLQARNKALSVNAPAGQAWSLELRGMDGRLQRSVSGTGSALVPWSNSGITIALLKSGRETVTGRFISAR